METVTYFNLGHFCQHSFQNITWKSLKISQPNLLHLLSR